MGTISLMKTQRSPMIVMLFSTKNLIAMFEEYTGDNWLQLFLGEVINNKMLDSIEVVF